MDKKETNKLADVYGDVSNHPVIITEASWGKPYNPVATTAMRDLAGRGGSAAMKGAGLGAAAGSLLGVPGAVIGAGLGAAAGKVAEWLTPEEWHGKSELRDETNEVWGQFQRQILSQDKNPKGSNILGWFKNTLAIDPKVIPALNSKEYGIKPNKRYYDYDQLRNIFANALHQARQFSMVGGAYDQESIYRTDPKLILRSILDMDSRTSGELVRYLIAKMQEDEKFAGNLSMVPAKDLASDKDIAAVKDKAYKEGRSDVLEQAGREALGVFETTPSDCANIVGDAGNMSPKARQQLCDLLDSKDTPEAEAPAEDTPEAEEPVEDTPEPSPEGGEPAELEGEPDETA